MSLNKVMLIGNVGQDPEVRYLDNSSSGNKVATFRLATTERYKDRNSGETREITEWHSVVAWRNSADIVEKYVKKGTQLYVEGRLRTRSWDDQNGNKRYTTEIIADSLQLLGKKADNPGAASGQQYSQPVPQPQQQGYQPQPYTKAEVPVQQAPAQPAAPAIPEDDDDLPF